LYKPLLIFFGLLLSFVIGFYLGDNTWDKYVDRDYIIDDYVSPGVINYDRDDEYIINLLEGVVINQEQLLILFGDYERLLSLPKTVYVPTDTPYISNVFPSEQCRGKRVSSMTALVNPHFTGSMRPYLYGGDTIYVVDYDSRRDLVLGDIIGTDVLLHRIVAIDYEDRVLWTKGDNNLGVDDPVSFDVVEFVVCGVFRGTT
jgi:hypothetical protein